jgi:hypothetical protein
MNPNINTNEEGLHTGFQGTLRRGKFGVDDVEVDNAPLALVIRKHLQGGERPAVAPERMWMREETVGDGGDGVYNVDIMLRLRIGVGGGRTAPRIRSIIPG